MLDFSVVFVVLCGDWVWVCMGMCLIGVCWGCVVGCFLVVSLFCG